MNYRKSEPTWGFFNNQCQCDECRKQRESQCKNNQPVKYVKRINEIKHIVPVEEKIIYEDVYVHTYEYEVCKSEERIERHEGKEEICCEDVCEMYGD